MTSDEIRAHCTLEACSIWTKHASKYESWPGVAHLPMIRESYAVNADVLFVGFNPSFTKEGINLMAKAMKVSEDDILATLLWPTGPWNIDSRQLARAAESETHAKDLYFKYFKPLELFRNSVGALSHCHLDVLLLRHTSQKELLKSFGEHFDQMKEHSFIKEQIQLFEWTLKAMSPRVVVVANAKASDVLVDALPLVTRDGGRMYGWSQLPDVPFFLSGMLSGQRALDRYSQKRLELDVATALRRGRRVETA